MKVFRTYNQQQNQQQNQVNNNQAQQRVHIQDRKKKDTITARRYHNAITRPVLNKGPAFFLYKPQQYNGLNK